jgi:hypothetical protein
MWSGLSMVRLSSHFSVKMFSRAWDKADETGARGLSTELTSPEVKPLTIYAFLLTERGGTHAAFGVLVDKDTPIALSLFFVAHPVSSCVCRRDHNLCRDPHGRWVGHTLTFRILQDSNLSVSIIDTMTSSSKEKILTNSAGVRPILCRSRIASRIS